MLFIYNTNKESNLEEISFTIFDTNLNNIREIVYPIPDKDYKSCVLTDMHSNYSDEFFIAAKVHKPYNAEHQASKSYISKYNFESDEFVNLLITSDNKYYGSGIRFQSNSNNGELGLLVATYIPSKQYEAENKIEKEFHLEIPCLTWDPMYGRFTKLFFYIIDTESFTVKVKKQINSLDQMKKFQSPIAKVDYISGTLKIFEKNKNGTFTIVGEPMRFGSGSQGSASQLVYFSILLLNLTSDGTIGSLQFIPKKQSSFNGLGLSIAQYLSFQYIQKDGYTHLFFNGIKSHYDAETEKDCRNFSSISKAHTFYVKVKPDGTVNKSFLLSSPSTDKNKFFNVNLFYVDKDKETVTMEVIDKKGSKRTARLVSFEIDDL